MAHSIQNNFRVRKSFAKIPKVSEIPNLIDIQKHSYEKFLQADIPPEKRQPLGLSGRVPLRLSHQGLQRDGRARLRLVRARQAQVRRRRVPPTGHDVLRANPGQGPVGGLRQGRGDGPEDHSRRQGARRLLRRDPPDDGQRDLHHQWDGARGGQPTPPVARRLLRPRQGQEPLVGQAALQRPDHPYRGSWIDFEFNHKDRSTSASIADGSSPQRC